MNYRKYLKSDGWLRKRRQVKYWHGKKCHVCNSNKVDIHHKTYKDLGNEDQKTQLIPLCRNCHFKIHNLSIENKINIYQATEQFIKQNKVKPKKRNWKKMTPFERESFLDKSLL